MPAPPAQWRHRASRPAAPPQRSRYGETEVVEVIGYEPPGGDEYPDDDASQPPFDKAVVTAVSLY